MANPPTSTRVSVSPLLEEDSCEQRLQWISSLFLFHFYTLSVSLICCSSDSILPLSSLFCWSAYHLVWDGDLIGHLPLVSLIASNCDESVSLKHSITAFVLLQRSWRAEWSSEKTRSPKWTSSSSWDQTQTLHVSNVLLRHLCLRCWLYCRVVRASVTEHHLPQHNNRDLGFFIHHVKSWKMFHMRKEGFHSRETWDDLFSLALLQRVERMWAQIQACITWLLKHQVWHENQ